MTRKKSAVAGPKAEAFHAPFAGLEKLRDALPSAPTNSAAAERAAPPRAVVRLERKGRGGKEVTVVEQLDLSAADRQAWLADLRRALGCGGVEEEGALVLQGDHRRRVAEWLRARGVRRVSVG